jgi:peroxiredoxin
MRMNRQNVDRSGRETISRALRVLAMLGVAVGLTAGAVEAIAQAEKPEAQAHSAELDELIATSVARIREAEASVVEARLQAATELEAFAKSREGSEDAAFALLVAGVRLMEAGKYSHAEATLRRGLDQAEREETIEGLQHHLALLTLGRGKAAPEFTATSTAGGAVSLEDFRGQYVLLDFWATWCAPCIEQMPKMRALHEQYEDRGLKVIGVSVDQDLEALEEYLKREEPGWLQIADRAQPPGHRLAPNYGVDKLPRLVLIGPDGRIVHPNPTLALLESGLDELMPRGE